MKALTKAKVALARRKAGIPTKVTPTGRVIDMASRQGWGWALCKWDYDEATDSVRTGGWCHPRPVAGDLVEISTKAEPAQRVKVIVLKVEYCRDPDDMWFANVEGAPS